MPAEGAGARDTSPLRVGDTLAIVVEGHETLSATPVVSSDGFIVLPSVGAVRVEGSVPSDVSRAIEQSLGKSLEAPRVSVVVVARKLAVSVVGEVAQPGKYVIDSRDGVVEALALAGGLTEFADDESIFLVRSSLPSRIRFRMDDLVSGGNSAGALRLRDRDVISVE